MRRSPALCLRLLPIVLLGCLDQSPPLSSDCHGGFLTPPELIPRCLETSDVLSPADRTTGDSLILLSIALRDSFRAETGSTNFTRAAQIDVALQHLSDFYGNNLFADSARFHRMVDHLAVTLELARGTLIDYGGVMYPVRTPWLSWHLYPGLGVHFQPVNTMQEVEWLMPRGSTPDDSIIQMSEHLYRYLLWRTADGRRFPVWEYEFPWSSGGVSVPAPWISGMAQGLGLALFAEAYKRTNSPVWRSRTYEVLNSLYVPWQDGGVLLPDTSHGYWWEEYHPTVQVWNGSALALLGVGYAAQIMHDPEMDRLFSRGIDALKYYTPFYDTGSWTRYSRMDAYNSVSYHHFCIAILDALYAQTNDPWFKTTADRWRTYVPPPGVK